MFNFVIFPFTTHPHRSLIPNTFAHFINFSALDRNLISFLLTPEDTRLYSLVHPRQTLITPQIIIFFPLTGSAGANERLHVTPIQSNMYWCIFIYRNTECAAQYEDNGLRTANLFLNGPHLNTVVQRPFKLLPTSALSTVDELGYVGLPPLIEDHEFIIVAETWPPNSLSTDKIVLSGYTKFFKNRVGRQGGGCIVCVEDNFRTIFHRPAADHRDYC